MKQKYGDVSLKEEESDDSTSESEDDQAEVCIILPFILMSLIAVLFHLRIFID